MPTKGTTGNGLNSTGAERVTVPILNHQQKTFCEIYLSQAPFYNGLAAVTAAGYKNARSSYQKLMENSNVQLYLEYLREQYRERCYITLDDMVKQLAKIAWFDIRNLFKEDGTLKDIHELDDAAGAAIAGIEWEDLKGVDAMVAEMMGARFAAKRKVKLRDSIKAMELIAKLLGFIKEEKSKERKIVRDRFGNVIQVEDISSIEEEDRVIFEDHTLPPVPNGNSSL